MYSKKIKLEPLVDGSTEAYKATYIGEQGPSSYEITYSEHVDEHYILVQKSGSFGEERNEGKQNFGIAHTKKEAEKRLHSKAKDLAEMIARIYGVRDLEDFTQFAPKDLPRGGK